MKRKILRRTKFPATRPNILGRELNSGTTAKAVGRNSCLQCEDVQKIKIEGVPTQNSRAEP